MTKKVLIIILIVAIVGCGIFGFLWMRSAKKLTFQTREFQKLTEQVENLQTKIRKNTCDTKCKSLGYAAGVCRRYSVVLDIHSLKCEGGEISLGGTFDCPTVIVKKGELAGGGGQSCCCREKELSGISAKRAIEISKESRVVREILNKDFPTVTNASLENGVWEVTWYKGENIFDTDLIPLAIVRIDQKTGEIIMDMPTG